MSVCAFVCLFKFMSECLSVELSVWQCLSVCFNVVSGLNCIKDLGLSSIQDAMDATFLNPGEHSNKNM